MSEVWSDRALEWRCSVPSDRRKGQGTPPKGGRWIFVKHYHYSNLSAGCCSFSSHMAYWCDSVASKLQIIQISLGEANDKGRF